MFKRIGLLGLAVLAMFGVVYAATVVPNEVQQPGTQPGQVSNLESPNKCDNCHGGYNAAVEPAHNWRGSMMAQATRDPIFWAMFAITEQDFDGAGDLCLRCHTPEGWLGGRSTPTDGSALQAGDADGVTCDFCHKMTRPDNSEHIGVQSEPFVANDGGTPPNAYLGSGMYSISGGTPKLGPFVDANATHQFAQSKFHRSVDFCGTCHDVSNPAVGDLAPNNGAPQPLAAGTFSGVLGTPVNGKAAFNNFPYQYGVVERTFSEFSSSLISQTLVSQYAGLPADLKDGALKAAYDSAMVAGKNGNYADNTARYFSCQTCHMRAVTGQGCNKNPPIRPDLPLHDMTGGNYWMPDAIAWMNARSLLKIGNGMTSTELTALTDGKTRALKQLASAATLSVNGNSVKVINHTGHKLISGYPEGRRMWLNIEWYDAGGLLVREDGDYGQLTVTLKGQTLGIQTLLNPEDPNTKIYEAHYGLTQEWASALISLGYSPSLALTFDRVSGQPTYTLAQLAAQAPGTSHESFHFVLNNTVIKDNRIPPYGFSYDAAKQRNALPVPAEQYGSPLPGESYQYWDEIALNPPAGAAYAKISLMYQPTSWEFVQFLVLANNGSIGSLANQGQNLLNAWLNTGMAAPYAMATATWGTLPTPKMRIDALTTWTLSKSGALSTQTSTFSRGATVAVKAHAVDANALALSGGQVFAEIRNSAGARVTSLQGFTDVGGNAVLQWKTAKTQAVGLYTATIVNVQKNGYEFDPAASTTSLSFRIQ